MSFATWFRTRVLLDPTRCLECRAPVGEGEGFRVRGYGVFCSEAHAVEHQTFAGI